MSTTVATLPRHEKRFTADEPWLARSALSDWLGDFKSHGPLKIRSIRVDEAGDQFVATVCYSEMEIEPAPRHFEDYVPALKKAS